MLAFRVLLNGKKVATAGISGPHVVSTIVSSVARKAEARRAWRSRTPFRELELSLHVRGLISSRDEHVAWADIDLKVGDRVSLRVVEVAAADEPLRRRKPEPLSPENVRLRERLERQMLKRLKRKYETSSKWGSIKSRKK